MCPAVNASRDVVDGHVSRFPEARYALPHGRRSRPLLEDWPFQEGRTVTKHTLNGMVQCKPKTTRVSRQSDAR
ncbi:unnamed protein product [Vitrella brassicaformis CCMP3155]|uniref:Uncharacterized protein n=1 Tax=Vitrella brassicaformis (strain CCMP3155) TaxID=1169540 RepID=A0A0G4H6R1_VITBC|nr:unnamed protein product [Vitrella brassicaformis CCMP3155]|eukprot:CEM39371.1 unnamed protein product [Vitrella brassicaformis CCMP3155]